MEFTKLNNGVQMPMQGIGTFLLTPDEAETSATYALKNGCQLIDTASVMYHLQRLCLIIGQIMIQYLSAIRFGGALLLGL